MDEITDSDGPSTLSYEIVASGVRNSVGFDWHPTAGNMFFTDNGADWLGDDLPPDEFNCIPKDDITSGQVVKNNHFGFPYCYGKQNLE